MSTQVRWRKSRRSGAESNCVEVSHHLDALRDSKNPTVTLPSDISRLLDAVKGNRLTR